MTALYRIDMPAPTIAAHFGARAGDDPWAGGYVAPGSFAPVITAGREFIAGARLERQPRRMIPRLWGVPPPPGASDTSRAVLTVRNPDSPFWVGNLRNSEFRCLLPATCWFEWGDAIDTEGRRMRYRVTCADQPLLAFAAVWKDAEVPCFALLTCPANAALRRIGRDRMPVVLPAGSKAQDQWLRAGWDQASALIAPYPADGLQCDLVEWPG